MSLYKSIAVQGIDINGKCLDYRSIMEASMKNGIPYQHVRKSLRYGARVNGLKFYPLIKPKPGFRFIHPFLDESIEHIKQMEKSSWYIFNMLKKADALDQTSDLVRDLKTLHITCQRLRRKYNRQKNA